MIGKKYIIWIRHPKTAGSSIRSYLLNPKEPVNENNLNVNYSYDGEYLTQLTNWWTYHNKDIDKNKIIALHTSYIKEFKEKNPYIWKNSFKFSISRNPYDRFISSWKYTNIKNIDFENLHNIDYTQLNKHDYYHTITPQTHNLIYNDKLNIDYVVKFENLEDSFFRLLEILNLPIYNNLPHIRKTNRTDFMYYYENNNIMKEFVYNLFKDDFTYYNYEF